MQLTEDMNQSHYQIQAYQPGAITINDKKYTQSLIITPNTLITDWEPQSLADLKPEHLGKILALKPEIILLGTGETFERPPTALLAPFYQNQFSVECMDTGAACRTFIALASEGRNVVAGLFNTVSEKENG